MRLSLRKVVKYSTFLILFFTLNVWVSYNVNLWSFSNTREVGKVRKSLGPSSNFDDNGGKSEPTFDSYNLNVKNPFETFSDLRKQRSAKSLTSFDASSIRNSELNTLQPHELNAVQQVVARHQVTSVNNGNNNNPPKSDSNRQLTELEDIFISIKTTLRYHDSRVRLLLKTWFGLAAKQAHFFTDGNDPKLALMLGEHLINTNCSTDHSRRALSCKMAVEFDAYLASRKRWFCHVDDDVYVNIPQLLELLRKYNHKEDWYLGKPSLKHPLEVADRENIGMKLTFWFATGGAGFCISRSLALKMIPYAGGGRFMTTAEKIRLPDDCTLGYIIEYLLRQRLTIIPEFHSHLENLWLIKQHMLKKQITFSFSEYSGRKNVVNVPGFSPQKDPTRFRSLHCYLFPNFKECRELAKTTHIPREKPLMTS